MMEQEIVDYILQAQKHGLSDFEIKQNLLAVGWEALAVEDSFVYARAAENKSQLNLEKSPAASSLRQSLSAHFESQNEKLEQPAIGQIFSKPVHHSIAISEQNFAKMPSPNNQAPNKTGLWILGLIAVLLLAGGAYAYYTYIYASPAKIWSKVQTTQPSRNYHNTLVLNYTDNTAKIGSSTQSISLSFQNEGDFNSNDQQNPKTASAITLGFKSGPEEFNQKFNYIILGKVFYFDIGQIASLKNLLGMPNIQWLKADLNALQTYLKSSGPGSSDNFDLLKNDAAKTQLTALWSKASLMKLNKKLIKETLDGQPVYHLKGEFDNQALASTVIESLGILSSATSSIPVLDKPQKEALAALINKFKVRELDLWVGQKDYRLYKVHAVVAAPSIIDLSNNNEIGEAILPLAVARSKSRDARRIADARQMSSALELYFNDFNGYPEAENGKAKGLEPVYIGSYPQAPMPADGTCSDFSNTYWYTPIGQSRTVKGVKVYPDYQFKICLGQTTGGHLPGWANLTPAGIKSGQPCKASLEHCQKTPQAEPDFSAMLAKMSFAAEFKIDSTFSNFGKITDITAPAESTDVLDLIKNILPNPASVFAPASDTSTPALK